MLSWQQPQRAHVLTHIHINIQGHHNINNLKESLERGSAKQSSLKGRERAIVNQTLELFQRQRWGNVWQMSFSKCINTIMNWTELTSAVVNASDEILLGNRCWGILVRFFLFLFEDPWELHKCLQALPANRWARSYLQGNLVSFMPATIWQHISEV